MPGDDNRKQKVSDKKAILASYIDNIKTEEGRGSERGDVIYSAWYTRQWYVSRR